MSTAAELETMAVEYRVAAHLALRTAVVAAAGMKTSSAVLHSGSPSAAGSLIIRAHSAM